MKYLIIIHIIAGHWTGKTNADIDKAPYVYKTVSVDTLYSNSYKQAWIIAENINNSEGLGLPKGCKAWNEGFTRYQVRVEENKQ